MECMMFQIFLHFDWSSTAVYGVLDEVSGWTVADIRSKALLLAHLVECQASRNSLGLCYLCYLCDFSLFTVKSVISLISIG